MKKEKRNSRRRPMRYRAWLALGPTDIRVCLLSDVSETGARIDVENAKEPPDRFLLLLSQNGAARRPCQVVWRSARQLGVRFEPRLTRTEPVLSAVNTAPLEESAAVEPGESKKTERADAD